MICDRCGVKIDGNKAIFSYGKTGSLERLYSRVCRYTEGRGEVRCINPRKTYVKEEDYGAIPTVIDHDKLATKILSEVKNETSIEGE